MARGHELSEPLAVASAHGGGRVERALVLTDHVPGAAAGQRATPSSGANRAERRRSMLPTCYGSDDLAADWADGIALPEPVGNPWGVGP